MYYAASGSSPAGGRMYFSGGAAPLRTADTDVEDLFALHATSK